ncbi:hypothetical protein BJ980_001061 [Nocardioides daedukensis]|uniref:Nuclear transport factor 2 family protein n=1 Tax=Nocardioides daedukensis TaxID=634462 RepID=A0A7Y9UN35_9ACTN|nr:DUF6318 family protein [Nocardioides daedukensis]NYG58138.1 hypothetical protein [Nocardioides daedukensis]
MRHGLVGLACLSLLVLAACGDKDSKTDEPGSPSPSASASSPNAAALPEDRPADEITPATFSRLWISLYSDATTSGDTARLRRLSLKDCEFCEFFAKDLEDIYKSGGEIVPEGDAHKIVGMQPAVEGPDGKTRVECTVRSSAAKMTLKAGAPLKNFEAVNRHWEFVLVKDQGKWRISQVTAQ